MSEVKTERLNPPGYCTIRKGNWKAGTSFWANRGRLFMALSTTILFVVFALLIVWTNHQCVRVGYTITALHKEKAALNDLNRKFKLELANLTALDRLENEARSQLGLVAPSSDQVQVIE